jgi:hypothetical protein
MLHFDRTGDLKRSFLLTAVERNKNSQLRLRALQEIAQSRDADAFERAVDVVRTWSRDERREGVKVLLQALAERRIGRRDQASHWIWDLADMTRDVHEEYAVQRWPETKRLLGLLVNSSGGAHARNARRLVHAARKQDRRLSAALLAAAVAHTPEAMEVVRGARTRMARKPSALSRELLRNFPKRKTRSRRRRRKGEEGRPAADEVAVVTVDGAVGEELETSEAADAPAAVDGGSTGDEPEAAAPRPRRRRASRRKSPPPEPVSDEEAEQAITAAAAALREASMPGAAAASAEPDAPATSEPAGEQPEPEPVAAEPEPVAEKPKPRRRRTANAKAKPAVVAEGAAPDADAPEEQKPRRRRAPVKAPQDGDEPPATAELDDAA